MSNLSPELRDLIYQLNQLTVQVAGIISVSGSVQVTNFPVTWPVTGNFYPVTQPISIASLPMQAVSNASIVVSATVATSNVKILSANANRKGLIVYNNSANSGYVAYGQAANSNTSMSRILATFAQFVMEAPIYTGDIYAIRNAGTGTFLCTELT